MRTSHNGERATAGSPLAIAGGVLLAVGALLPWLAVNYALPRPRRLLAAPTRTAAR